MNLAANDPCPCGSGLKFQRCCREEGNPTWLNSPEELIAARFQALLTGEYEQLYASYHPEAPLLQQFSDRGSYLRFAREQLRDVKVVNWQALGRRKLGAERVEQLLVMELSVAGASSFFYELALLVRTGAGWRYHSAQKLSEEDYAGPPENIDFHHFDNSALKIRY
jgi:SEC-C motif-containing protein